VCLAIHALTLHVFVFRPFKGADGIARFMW
jgi:hypothetical protein